MERRQRKKTKKNLGRRSSVNINLNVQQPVPKRKANTLQVAKPERNTLSRDAIISSLLARLPETKGVNEQTQQQTFNKPQAQRMITQSSTKRKINQLDTPQPTDRDENFVVRAERQTEQQTPQSRERRKVARKREGNTETEMAEQSLSERDDFNT